MADRLHAERRNMRAQATARRKRMQRPEEHPSGLVEDRRANGHAQRERRNYGREEHEDNVHTTRAVGSFFNRFATSTARDRMCEAGTYPPRPMMLQGAAAAPRGGWRVVHHEIKKRAVYAARTGDDRRPGLPRR